MKLHTVAAVVLCFSLTSFAQAKKPAPKAEPPAPAPAAPSAGAPDPALLQAILYVYEPGPPEIRALAVEDLGLLGDPRALNVLADCALDPQPAVQDAAVRALRAFKHPRAEEILANLVRHPRPSPTLKIAALEGLVYQGTPNATALLQSLRDDARMDSNLRDAARQLLSRLAPQR